MYRDFDSKRATISLSLWSCVDLNEISFIANTCLRVCNRSCILHSTRCNFMRRSKISKDVREILRFGELKHLKEIRVGQVFASSICAWRTREEDIGKTLTRDKVKRKLAILEKWSFRTKRTLRVISDVFLNWTCIFTFRDLFVEKCAMTKRRGHVC